MLLTPAAKLAVISMKSAIRRTSWQLKAGIKHQLSTVSNAYAELTRPSTLNYAASDSRSMKAQNPMRNQIAFAHSVHVPASRPAQASPRMPRRPVRPAPPPPVGSKPARAQPSADELKDLEQWITQKWMKTPLSPEIVTGYAKWRRENQ